MTTTHLAAAHASHPRPTGAAFDVILLLHVLCVVIGLGTVLVSGVQAGRLRRAADGPLPEGLCEYFAPGANWAGRALYGVPVFGFVLLGMARGAYGLGDGWVLEGLALWALAALGAEGFLWPAERRVQAGLAGDGGEGPSVEIRQECRTISWMAIALVLVLVLATVLMVVQP
jgi:hypothetical protein